MKKTHFSRNTFPVCWNIRLARAKRSTGCNIVRRTDNKRLAKYITENYKRAHTLRGVSLPCFGGSIQCSFANETCNTRARARDELCQIFRLATFYRCIEFTPACLLKYICMYNIHEHISASAPFLFYLSVVIQMNSDRAFFLTLHRF